MHEIVTSKINQWRLTIEGRNFGNLAAKLTVLSMEEVYAADIERRVTAPARPLKDQSTIGNRRCSET